ncbi:MAG: hypothetical protein HKN47_13280 [Pirellulaceae bacterium]|nr:hypothetical protein [Pirellulaceae bacterium]
MPKEIDDKPIPCDLNPQAASDTVTSATSGRFASKRIRRAVIISVALHVVALLGLLFWYFPTATSESKTASTNFESDDATVPGPPRLPPPPPADDVPDEQIQKSIESQIEQVRRLPDEKKLSELEKNLKRLDAISSPQSVQDVTVKITSSLGLDPQQYQPKESVPEGEFDFDTAQLANVTREKDESGDWVYQSTLVDAQGHKFTAPMPDADGETMYETFQQMERYPMAAGIYRSVVMPLMQKMIEAQRLAESAAAEAERINAEQADADSREDTAGAVLE